MLLMALMMMADKPWQGGEIKERLESPITASFDTAKRADQLEICLADVLSVTGSPTVLRDGPDNIVILSSSGFGGAYLASVSVNKTATGSHLDLRIRGKGWDDRMKERITVCLA
jgi:hypothetical protein